MPTRPLFLSFDSWFSSHHWLILFRQNIRLTEVEWRRICWRLNLATQPFFQFRVSVAHSQISYSIGEGFGLTDEHADFLGSRDSGVDEVALKHYEMSHQDRDDHDGYSEP